jgi:hypothetical protein
VPFLPVSAQATTITKLIDNVKIGQMSEIHIDFTPPIYNLAKQSIADMFGVDKATINRVLQIGQMSEMQQDFTPPIYNIWNLAKQSIADM